MDNKIKGSWLIHHTNKLQSVTSTSGFQKTYSAGKAGILLSAISANDQVVVQKKRLETLATAANITTIELPGLLGILEERKLIEKSVNGIEVLGVTTTSALQHTADIFNASNPTPQENAVIYLAEEASKKPIAQRAVAAELSDKYLIPQKDIDLLLTDSEQIGFVDVENVGGSEKIYFNGNLFRRDEASKIKLILDSLAPPEQRLLTEFNDNLRRTTCATVDDARKLLGDKLFSKVTAVGLYDINIVSNNIEEVGYLTLPSAFSKYSTSMVDDAFDFAKAFVSSITYGMTKSKYERGEIRMVEALLDQLIRGNSVGPVRAIAEDYKLLEMRGVVQVYHGTKNGRTGPLLKLLKREVGELARQAIISGDVSEHSLTNLPSASVTRFSGPEKNRERIRKKQVAENPKTTNDMLQVLRTGGGF